MTQLYQTALPAAQANTSDEGVRAQIQQSGLLQEGGTATEKIASENIDLVIEGEIELGARFAEKLATEIESIGESDYSGIPLYTIGATNGGRNAGYYEVEQVDVSPAHPVTGESYSYTLGLKSSETRQDKWSAVQTKIEDVETGLATGSNSLIGLPATATKVRWYSESSGKENASVDSTVSAEFGNIDLYDPASAGVDSTLNYTDTHSLSDTGAVYGVVEYNSNWYVLDGIGGEVDEYNDSFTYQTNHTLSSASNGTSDLVEESGTFYALDFNDQVIDEYNDSFTFQTSHSVSETVGPSAFVFDGTNWYVLDGNETIFEYDSSFSYTGTSFDVSSEITNNTGDGLVWTGNEFWLLESGTETIYQYDSSFSYTGYNYSLSNTSAATGMYYTDSSFYVGASGELDVYDLPDTDAITNPMLLYELAYEDSGDVDVRVYDDKGVAKTYSVTSGGTTVEASQWPHAYHTSYEFEGDPVVDNGLLRLRFDEANGVVEAYEWNDGTSSWDALTVTHGDYELVDADFEKISPVDVRVFTEWYDTVDDRLEQALISVQRGLDRAIARYPPNTTQTSGLESVLGGFVGDYTTDTKPERGLEARSEVK